MNTPQATLTPSQIRMNRIKLLILWLVPFGLMAIAGLCYYLVQTGQLQLGSKNNGTLIRPPIQLHETFQELALIETGQDAKALSESPWQQKWTMVVPAFDSCDEACEKVLYLTRQLHIRLDKNANRVQRVLLASPAAQDSITRESLNTLIDKDHLLLKRLVVTKGDLGELASALGTEDSQAQFFVVDPQGWAMMYYTAEHDGNAILADLKHLLKYSRER